MSGVPIPEQPGAVLVRPDLPIPSRRQVLQRATPIAVACLLIGLPAIWWVFKAMADAEGRPWHVLLLTGIPLLAWVLALVTRAPRPTLRGVWWSSSYVNVAHRDSVRANELPQSPLVRVAVAALACGHLEGAPAVVTMVVVAVFGMVWASAELSVMTYVGWFVLAAIPLYRSVRAWKYLSMYEGAQATSPA
ncbi:hypothetical protein [Kocuria himachalensis]